MTKPEPDIQIIKTRDDHNAVHLRRDTNGKPHEQFKITGDTQCSWAKSDKAFGAETLRTRIEPWVTALVQSEHLSLLIGSGLTHAVHGLAISKELPCMKPATFNTHGDMITKEANRTAEAAGRESGNFEDQIRVANELLRGLEIIAVGKLEDATERKQVLGLQEDIANALRSFTDSILEGERDFALAGAENREKAFTYLVRFLMSFASRTGTRERLQIFTTNYDRFIEVGADIAGLRLIDRFIGTLAPVFHASRLNVDMHYNPPGIRGEPRYLEGVAHFTKLHGSVDWIDFDRAIRRIGLPFGSTDMKPYLDVAGMEGVDAKGVMVYPNAAKDRETTSYPYVELFRDFAASICRPNSTVICYGYGFGDDHINRVLEDMLTIPSTHLVVVAYGDPYGRMMQTYKRHTQQITLMIGNHLGDLQTLVDHYLPKPAIDRTTVRMADLLKVRSSTVDNGPGKPTTDKDDSGS